MLCVVLCVTLASAPAAADDAQDLARRAYDRGVAAHKQRAFERAAREFALADSLAPSPVALGAALDAAVSANEPVLGMELVLRSSRVSPLAPGLQRSVQAARKAFVGRTGRVRLVCEEGAPCSASLDASDLPARAERVVLVGEHVIVLRGAGAEESRRIQVLPDETLEVRPPARPAEPEPPAPVPAPPPAVTAPAPAPSASTPSTPSAPSNAVPPAVTPASTPASGKPLPPIALAVGGGLTALAGTLALLSAMDADDQHELFVAEGCARVASPACVTLSSNGAGAQTTANVLFVTTAGLGLATLVTAVFFVDYGSSKKAPGVALRLVPGAGPQGPGIRLTGAFW